MGKETGQNFSEAVLRVFAALVVTWGAYRAFGFWYLAAGLKHLSPAAWARFALLAFLVLAGWLWALAPAFLGKILGLWLKIRAPLGKVRWLFVLLAAVGVPIAVLWVPGYSKVYAKHSPTDAVVVWAVAYLLAALGVLLFLTEKPEVSLREGLVSLLLPAASFAFFGAYTKVSSYPFALSWSEGNRLWDYSLMFGRSRYIYPAGRPIPAHIDPGRQFLWGLVFLIPGVGIFWARLWSAIMFTVPYLLFAFTAFWKPKQARRAGVFVALWAFLFLRQGPIYTPLLLSAWLILLAADSAPWLGAVLAFVGGYLAAVTRFTWVLAPFLWAAMLTLGAVREQKDFRNAWRKFAWLGSAALLGSLISGSWLVLFSTLRGFLHKMFYGSAALTAHSDFAASQPLIWDRLFPNPTFQPGILLGVLLAVVPVLVLLGVWRRQGLWRLHRWALVLDGLILAAFLAVGVLVSLKIGGGSNLHNLDMFLISLVLLAVVAWRQGGWRWAVSANWRTAERWLAAVLVVVPMYFLFLGLTPHQIPEERWWKPALNAVRHYVHKAQFEGKGEILFMDQRQLLTFGFVKGVPLVPDYEKKLMMDEAMAGNKDYFAKYYHDLAKKRFALMITPVFRIDYQQESSHNFAAENNAWDRWVAAPTLCYYKPIYTEKHLGFEILVPRRETRDCSRLLPVPPSP